MVALPRGHMLVLSLGTPQVIDQSSSTVGPSQRGLKGRDLISMEDTLKNLPVGTSHVHRSFHRRNGEMVSVHMGCPQLWEVNVLCSSITISQGYLHENNLSGKSVFCWGRIDSRRR